MRSGGGSCGEGKKDAPIFSSDHAFRVPHSPRRHNQRPPPRQPIPNPDRHIIRHKIRNNNPRPHTAKYGPCDSPTKRNVANEFTHEVGGLVAFGPGATEGGAAAAVDGDDVFDEGEGEGGEGG